MDAGLIALIVFHLGTRELLALAAFGIAISSLDDLMIDLIFLTRRLWRNLTVYNRHPRAMVEDLVTADPGWMAIIVPAWDEADVIGDMLQNLITKLQYPRYRVFVGVYPNDLATQHVLALIADPRLEMVVCSLAGPTTKADCLNHLWRAIGIDETLRGRRFTAVVLHDAEDVVHPQELWVYNHLLAPQSNPRPITMVQLPVLPLVDKSSRWISGHYLDEFAELHSKDIIVREAIGAAVPSAGVACAIERGMLGRIAGMRPAEEGPFDADCLTEDYELGIKIKALSGRGTMVRIRCRTNGELVATHEHFPATLDAALRQKTRWLLGIALSGWDRVGWQGGITCRYMLLRDRKVILASGLTVIGYGVALMVLIDMGLGTLLPSAGRLKPLVPSGSPLDWLLTGNVALLGWRLLWRAIYTGRAYGWREGLRAVPRALVGNAINALAAFRACRRYWRIAKRGEANYWDKTAHRFPTTSLVGKVSQ